MTTTLPASSLDCWLLVGICCLLSLWQPTEILQKRLNDIDRIIYYISMKSTYSISCVEACKMTRWHIRDVNGGDILRSTVSSGQSDIWMFPHQKYLIMMGTLSVSSSHCCIYNIHRTQEAPGHARQKLVIVPLSCAIPIQRSLVNMKYYDMWYVISIRSLDSLTMSKWPFPMWKGMWRKTCSLAWTDMSSQIDLSSVLVLLKWTKRSYFS